MRQGEMLAMRFGHIDWKRHLIVLRAATTKSRKSRVVPISTTRLRVVLEWLSTRRRRRREAWRRAGLQRRDRRTTRPLQNGLRQTDAFAGSRPTGSNAKREQGLEMLGWETGSLWRSFQKLQ
jgi:integrase